MEKLSQNETALALSQLIQTSLNKSLYGSPVDMLMPFLALHKGAHRLAQGKFAQTNRLADMTWGEPHITHVSRESHNHNHYTNNRYLNQTENWSKPVANAGSSVSQHSIHTVAGSSNTGQSATDAIKTEPSSENIEQSIIGRCLAYRPFFVHSGRHKRLLNTNKPANCQASINNVVKCVNTGEPLAANKAISNNTLSWSVPLHIAEAGSLISVQTGQHKSSNTFNTNPSRRDQYRIAILKQAPVPAQLTNRLPLFNYAEPIRTDELINLPQKKAQGLLPDKQLDSAMNISKSFSEKIEKMIAQKVIAETTKNSRDSVTLMTIKTELKANLRPERLITDEMIRILLEKLHKTVREERFRMGMLS